MGVSCQIFIRKSPTGAINAGDTISGIVKYALDEPTEFKKVELTLLGTAQCSFEKLVHDIVGFKPTIRSLVGHEDFLFCTKNLLQNRPEQTVTLAAAAYEHTFEFVIPKDIPSSYTSHGSILSGRSYRCYVTYFIKLKFEKANFFSLNKTFKKEIIVYGNLNPIAPDEPVTYGLEKSLLKPFSQEDHKIKLHAKILKSFSTPGEDVNLIIDIENNSDVVVNAVKCELVRKISLYANKAFFLYAHRSRETIQQTIEGSTIRQAYVGFSKTTTLSVKVPTKPELYSIQHSTIINVEYLVKVTLELPLPHMNTSLEVPLVIGESPDGTLDEILELDDEDDESPPPYWEVMGEEKEKT